MKNVLTCPSLVLLVLLGTYASHPQQQPVDSTTATTAATDISADSGWQTLRVNYTVYVQHQTDNGVSNAIQTGDVVASTLDACEDTSRTMHDSSRDHLSASILSSDTRKVASRVARDTREKARVYLVSYANYTRYLAKSR